MAGQFSLDVHLDQLRDAEKGLQQLSEHLLSVSRMAAKAPGELGSSWTGRAATSTKHEMTGLAEQTKRFSPMFHEASTAVKAFADAVEHALTTTIPQLNRQWDQAEQACTDAITKADSTYARAVADAEKLSDPAKVEEARARAADARGSARGEAAMGARWTMQAIDYQFQQLKDDLQARARTLGTTLGGLTIVAVPDSVARSFIGHHGTGSTVGWCNSDGTTFPPDLGTDDALAGSLTLVHDRHDMLDGEQAAALFTSWDPNDPKALAKIQGLLKTDSEAFRQGFLAHLDTKQLAFLQRISHMGVSGDQGKKYGEMISAISVMMAQGSNARLQGDYPVPATFYDTWRKQYAALDTPPGEGYLLQAEIVQAGQAGGDNWDPAMLTSITRETIAFEQKMHKENPTFFWGDIYRNGNGELPTMAARDFTGGVPGQVDAVALLFDALSHDHQAAQDVLRQPDGHADTAMLHYLYDGRQDAQGSFEIWGDALGRTLDAATSYVGPGGPGSRNYASAEIVGDLVHFYGTHPDRLPLLMRQPLVNILTHHVQAVNHAGFPYEEAVHEGHGSDLLDWQKLDMAVLDKGDLNTVLKGIFSEDYYSTHDGDPSKGYPLYQQLATAQHAAFRKDFLVIAGHHPFDKGLLMDLVQQQSSSESDTTHSLRDALTSQGASEDQANADARAAVDFVVGLGVDKLPMDKLGGPGGLVAGAAVDKIKEGLLNHFFPETDHKDAENQKGFDVLEYQREQNRLELVGWLDEAGLLDKTHSPAAWAAQHPDRSSFTEIGPDGRPHLGNIANLYAHRAAHPEAWDQFLDYYRESGAAALNNLDLGHSFDLGFLLSDDRHGGDGG